MGGWPKNLARYILLGQVLKLNTAWLTVVELVVHRLWIASRRPA